MQKIFSTAYLKNARNVRLLIISQYFHPENFRINDLAEGMRARGHTITVLTGMPNYPSGRLPSGYGWRGPYRERCNGVEVIRVPIIPRGRGGYLRLTLNYLSFALSASMLGAWRCNGKHDAILVFEPSPITVGIPARLIGWIKKTPILFWVQDLWPESLSATGAVSNAPTIKAVEWLVRWIYKGCARVLIQSEAFRASVKRLGVPDERVLYFPNSAEAFYRPLPKETAWHGPKLPEGFRIMFAGNLGAAQSLETVLAAAELLKAHKNIQWIIVGDGRLKDWLEKEIERRELQDCFHLMGRYPAESMPEWFAQADTMLVSLRPDPIFALTIPSKVQSYMACAKPIVAALDGEGARIIELSKSGIAVPAGNPVALAGAVQRMYEMPEAARRQLGARGLEYFARHFSRADLMDRLEGWIMELAGTR